LITRLLDSFSSRIAGLKDSSGDMAYARSAAAISKNFAVFPSTEACLLEARRGDFAGCISATANLNADLCARAWSGGDTTALEEFLSERRGSRVEVRVPERGEKRRLQELAQQNAQLALESETFVAETKRARRVEALEELRETLNLESLPIRIECFDISNIQGESVVGSMVVFQDAVAKKAHYRKFGVQSLDGQDDFAAMAEVVSRRFARLANADSEQHDESFAAMPNLVVIDGGKGQLSAALAAMQAFDLPRVAVIALAKKEEEVYVPGQPDAVRLPKHQPGLQLLQRIRDEAHRFALGFHRQRRNAKARGSILDELSGVGPVRRRALLRHFGSAERLLEATPEELEGVPGVPAKTARSIYAQLHKAGRA